MTRITPQTLRAEIDALLDLKRDITASLPADLSSLPLASRAAFERRYAALCAPPQHADPLNALAAINAQLADVNVRIASLVDAIDAHAIPQVNISSKLDGLLSDGLLSSGMLSSFFPPPSSPPTAVSHPGDGDSSPSAGSLPSDRSAASPLDPIVTPSVLSAAFSLLQS